MYSVSNDYLTALAAPVHTYRLTGTVGTESFTQANIISLSIDNQVSEGSEVKLGSVYAGELNATFSGLSIARGSWVGKTITLSEGLLLANDTYEDVPLGVFTIAEANHTNEGVQVVAYDAMTLFDKAINLTQTQGEPYDLIGLMCLDCGATFGMTKAEVEALPNGTETLVLFPESDIQTWRDFLSWLAATLCSVATIDRAGNLILRQYSTTSVASIDETHRFTGCSFSDFAAHYTGMSVVNTAAQTLKYYSVVPDSGLAYSLGANPFVQTDFDLVQNIIDDFSTVSLVPFRAQMLGGAIYDLCDCLTFTGGIASGAVCGVMAYEYTYNHGYTVQGFGSNPDLATAQSKTDKDIAGLSSRTDANKLVNFTYANASNISIADGSSDTVVSFHIVARTATWFIFGAEIKHTAATSETDSTAYTENDLVVTAKVYINSVLKTYAPVTTEQDGVRLVHLLDSFQVQPGSVVVDVVFECAGGAVSISAGNSRAYLFGACLEDFEIRSIYVKTMPTKVSYTENQNLDLDGCEIYGRYNDGTESDVTALCTFDPVDGSQLTEAGDQTVTVTYGDLETEIPITVTPLDVLRYLRYTETPTQYLVSGLHEEHIVEDNIHELTIPATYNGKTLIIG